MKRNILKLDKQWKFHLGDVTFAPVRGHDITYYAGKAEHAKGAAARDYDDNDWRAVDLPHDYVIEGTPDPEENSDHGYLKRDNAWYRRFFRIDGSEKNKRFTLEFDGVATACTVWVNGYLLKRHYTGGTGFEVDFTDVAKFDEDLNVAAVYVDNNDFEGWYYEGGGIYRHVRLVASSKVCVDYCGTYVTAQKMENGQWNTHVETTVRNDSFVPETIDLRTQIINDQGQICAEGMKRAKIEGRKKKMIVQDIRIVNPDEWNLDTPHLYKIESVIFNENSEVDNYETIFGYRTITFDSRKGFCLNDVPTPLNGMSNHQDYGNLGSALLDRVQEYRIQRLKDFGANAYRCAHNPHAPETYDICDRLGMLVMDETRWFGSGPQPMEELREMVIRDRNHPSVIMWSLFNEEPDMENERGKKMLEAMNHYCHELDASRPTTGAAFFGLEEKEAAENLDVIGINYHPEMYDKIKLLHPQKAMFASETGCGFFPFGIDAWKQIKIRPYMMGGFPWTGIAYRGECSWPDVISRCGVLNHIGNETLSCYMYQAYWSKAPYAKIVRSDKEDKIFVFHNGEEAELFIDGKTQGRKAADPFETFSFKVEEQKGLLKAAVYKAGTVYAEDSMYIAENPVKLEAEIIDFKVFADDDVQIINIWAVDHRGNHCIQTNGYPVKFKIDGGSIVCTGNGDTQDYEKPWIPERKLKGGCCQVIIRADEGCGMVYLSAENPELGKREIRIKVRHETDIRQAEAECNPYLYTWRMSDVVASLKELEEVRKEGVGESWIPVQVGRGSQMAFRGYFPGGVMMRKPIGENKVCIFYHTQGIVPAPKTKGNKLKLHFECLEGKADGICISRETKISFKKDDYTPGAFTADMEALKAGEKVEIWVRVEANTAFCAINRPVRWAYFNECGLRYT